MQKQFKNEMQERLVEAQAKMACFTEDCENANLEGEHKAKADHYMETLKERMVDLGMKVDRVDQEPEDTWHVLKEEIEREFEELMELLHLAHRHVDEHDKG